MSSKRARPNTPPTGAEIRQAFLDFFAERRHTIVPSSSLVPGEDPTLLFTNAGMVQFKDVFLGTGTRPYTRAADSQKCLRVAGKHNDLEDVGRDDTHHTFFEMLGNWSFGDYYKEEAIAWAWELLTEVWGLPKDRLWATCFEDQLGEIPRDDEAAEIWCRQPGFEPSHLLFFGREENFWEMAETGPCGPDSEVHLDLGPECCDRQEEPGHRCTVNGNCARFLELWNLVFIQYKRLSPSELRPLPQRHVDTGLGFERIVSVLQGVGSNYETDLFSPLMGRIQELGGHSDEQRAALLTPYRVISDHTRAACFLIADGVVPGNIGRNYVCRMIIRRASRFGNQAGFDEPFLARIAESVIAQYRGAYPELAYNQDAIFSTITEEEKRFQQTIEAGLIHLEQALISAHKEGAESLSGKKAFDLYATYGLPLEITRDIARERDMEVDEGGFRAALARHRSASNSSLLIESEQDTDLEVFHEMLSELRQTGKLQAEGVRYDPYSLGEIETLLLAMVKDRKRIGKAAPGDSVAIVLRETPFYAASGGQVSDTGKVISTSEPGWQIEIEDIRRPIAGLVVHFGKVISGQPAVGDPALADVDSERRWDIMRNHTATHLLHASLRAVLGAHARQAGSLVAPDRLRFDFTHPSALTPEELARIELEVNQAIQANYPLKSSYKGREEAIAEGAIALFGETYGETVREIRIGGPEPVSLELCGGTHVPQTGAIGLFKIVGQGSVAAGIRRIEALTGRAAFEFIQRRLALVERLARTLGTSAENLELRLESLSRERNELLRGADRMRQTLANLNYAQLQPDLVAGIPVLTGQIPDVDPRTLRKLVDRFRSEHPEGVIVLASSLDGKPAITAGVTEGLTARGLHAGELVKEVAKVVGGGGGGKATLAQAGGKDSARLEEALQKVVPWVKSRLASPP